MSTWMVYAAVVTLLMGGAAWVLERATRDLRVPTRWIWTAALIGSAVLPIVALLVRGEPVTNQSVDAGAAATTAAVDAPASLELSAEATPPLQSLVRLPTSWLPAIPPLPSHLDPIALIGWGLISVVLMFGLARAIRALRRARRGWAVERIDGRDVLVSDAVGPAVVGVLQPDIVMPRWALEMSPRDRELMLRHEDEHRRAGDAPLLMAAVLLSVLLPWNLPIWWQLRRLRLAVEVDCDRRVLRGSRDLRRYAALLVEIGRRRTSPLMSLALAEPASFLERRIRTMTHRPQPRFVRIAGLVIAAAALVFVAGKMDRPVVRAAAAEQLIRYKPDSGVGQQAQDPETATGAQLAAAPTTPATGERAGGGEAQAEAIRSVAGGTDVRKVTVPEAGQIRGRVTDVATGQPLSEARVVLTSRISNLVSVSTDAGLYALAAVPAGTHELRVERVGYATATRLVALTDGAVLETDFALTADAPVVRPAAAPSRAGARITGRVTDVLSGDPLTDVQVYLVGANIGAISRQTGVFLLLNVPAGSYTFRAERIGFNSVSHDITVREGEALEVNFQLSSAVPPIVPPGDQPQAVPALGTRIRLRGENSVNNQAPPIIIIDGVRVTPPPGGESPLSQIDPNDIDRIEVIKGEAATRLYGPEAQSGVIQIFKKKPGPGGEVSAAPNSIEPAELTYLRSLGFRGTK